MSRQPSPGRMESSGGRLCRQLAGKTLMEPEQRQNGRDAAAERGGLEPDEEKMGRRFSTLWIFVTLNYLYCDVISLMDHKLLGQYLTGAVGGVHITRSFLLGSAILMEIPIGMIVLSRVLHYRANRLANVAAGTIMTVVQFASLFFGASPTGYYIFFSVIEIASTAFIAWYAWTWRGQALRHRPQRTSARNVADDRVAALPPR